MNDKIVITNQKALLEELGSLVTKNYYNDSLKCVEKLCLINPFNTVIFTQLFINAWCAKILNLLDKDLFIDASIRIRSIYILVFRNKAFNNLINIYFKNSNELDYSQKLKNFDRAVHLSIKSQYFFQNKNYKDAEIQSELCIKEVKILIKESNKEELFSLVKKSLKNFNNSKKARVILEEFIKHIKR